MLQNNFGAVIVAAGSSRRMGASQSKVLMNLAGRPVLSYSLDALCACPLIARLAVVCRDEDREKIEKIAAASPKQVELIAGGPERQDSVLNGIHVLEDCDYLLIHDGARPLVTSNLVQAVCEDALQYGASAAAVRVKDTCKLVDEEGFVLETPPREKLMSVQTPQAFERALYLYAAERAASSGRTFTDDCQLVEAAGGRVHLVQGDYKNLKITTPEDLLSAEAFLAGEKKMRIGSGYDVHRLTEGRALILGGVKIPFEKGLLGHSDADVLAHAVADALLGAAALGDIGKLFPDTEERYRGADSLLLLSEVCRRVRESGHEIKNIDATVMAQRPKLAPYILQMREKLAETCGITTEQISVKATTEEGMGFTGSGEGMSATAVCLLS